MKLFLQDAKRTTLTTLTFNDMFVAMQEIFLDFFSSLPAALLNGFT